MTFAMIEIPPACCDGPYAVPSDTFIQVDAKRSYFRTEKPSAIKKLHEDDCATAAALANLAPDEYTAEDF